MTFFLFIAPSPVQVLVVLILGVLFFGKNLPDVAKRVGLSIMEFKKRLNEIGEATKEIATKESRSKNLVDNESEEQGDTEKYESIGSKFEPPSILS